MTNWKDTVIDTNSIKVDTNTARGLLELLSTGELKVSVTPLLESQAKISFEVGIKEVVGWIRNMPLTDYHDGYIVNEAILPRQLKEWGL